MKAILPVLLVSQILALQSFAQTYNSFHDLPEGVQVEVVLDPTYVATDEAPEQSPSSPPLATDDPGTPGSHNFEVNLISSCDQISGAKSCENGLDAAFGIGEKTQLRISKALIRDSNSTGPAFSGHGQTDIGVKHRFYDQDGLKLAVYPTFKLDDASRVTNTDGSLADSEGRSIYLPLIVSKDLGKYTVVTNVGRRLNLDHTENNSVFTSMAVGRAVGQNMRVMAELASEKTGDNRRTDVRVGFVRIILPDHSSKYQTSLFGSIGRSIKSTDDGQTHTSLLFGLSISKK